MIKDFIGKNKYWIKWGAVFLGCVFFVLLFYRCYLRECIPDSAAIIGNKDEFQIIHDLRSSDELEQVFLSERDFDYITVDFANHDLLIEGHIYATVYDKNHEVVNDTIVDSMAIQSQLKLEIAGGGKNSEPYTLKICNDNTEESGLGIYGYNIVLDGDGPSSHEETYAKLCGETQDYAVSIGIYSYTNLFLVMVRLILCVGLMGILVIIVVNGYYVVTNKDFPIEKRFLCISIPFAICMLLMINNYAYDELGHASTAYHYANNILGTSDGDNYRNLNARDVDCVYLSQIGKSGVINDQLMATWAWIQDFEWFTTDTQMVSWDEARLLTNGPAVMSLFPYIIAIVIGRVIHLGAMPMWMLAKILGTVMYLLACYFAIKRIPKAKGILAVCAATPMAIYTATSITYDAASIWATFSLLSYIVIWWQRKLECKEWVGLLASLIVLMGCKGGVYIPILLMLFAVPVSRWKLTKKRLAIGFSGLFAICIVFCMTYGKKLIHQFFFVAPDLSDSSYNYGTAYALRYPLAFIKLMVNTVSEKGDVYLGQLFGYRTQWMDGTVPMFVILLFIFIIIGVSITVPKENALECQCANENSEINSVQDIGKLCTYRRILIGIIVVAEFIGMHMILLNDTRTNMSIINGVQGRYFVPLLPLICMLLMDINVYRRSNSDRIYYIFMSISQALFMIYYIALFLTV